MDYFSEKIIEKQLTVLATILRALLFAAGGALAISVALLLPMANSFSVIIGAGIIYGVYYISKFFGVEYEYTVTNSDLDVDKIIARRKRKRILSTSFKEITVLSHISDSSFNSVKNSTFKNKFDATSGRNNNDVYFCIFQNDKYGKSLLTFEPSEKMLNIFSTLMPRTYKKN